MRHHLAGAKDEPLQAVAALLAFGSAQALHVSRVDTTTTVSRRNFAGTAASIGNDVLLDQRRCVKCAGCVSCIQEVVTMTEIFVLEPATADEPVDRIPEGLPVGSPERRNLERA